MLSRKASQPRTKAALLLLAAACAAAGVTAVLGDAPPVPTAAAAAAPPVAANPGHAPLGAAEATEAFRPFALNALLVPLLDIDDAHRWAKRPAHYCGQALVTVDGIEWPQLERIPDPPFVVHWRVSEPCLPLGTPIEVSGVATLVVQRVEGEHYVVTVDARGLEIATLDGVGRIGEAFEARTPHGRQ